MSTPYEMLRSGKASIQLPRLTIAGEGNGSFGGSGGVEWVAGQSLHLNSITYGDEGVSDDFVGSALRYGQLIPEEDYLQLEGRTADGWTLRAERINKHERPCVFRADSFTNWDVHLGKVSLTLPADSQESIKPGLLARLTGCEQLQFFRTTIESNDNPRFPAHSMSRDWLQFETKSASIAIRRADGGLIWVRIDGTEGAEQIERLLESVRLAVSFLIGRAAVVQGLALEDGCGPLVRFYAPKRIIKDYAGSVVRGGLPYLGQFEITERMLGLMTDFFETDKGKDLARYLMMFWDVQSNGITVKVAVTCQVLEAMVRFVREENVGYGGGKKIFKILEKWESKGTLGIDQNDLDAWKLRNATAHGELMYDPETGISQQTIDRSRRLENLVNRLTLTSDGVSGELPRHRQGMDQIQDRYL